MPEDIGDDSHQMGQDTGPLSCLIQPEPGAVDLSH